MTACISHTSCLILSTAERNSHVRQCEYILRCDDLLSVSGAIIKRQLQRGESGIPDFQI